MKLNEIKNREVFKMEEKKYGELEIEQARLERWPNPYPDRDYLIEIFFPEFTCKCPRSGYPDFAKIYIKYIPEVDSGAKESKAVVEPIPG